MTSNGSIPLVPDFNLVLGFEENFDIKLTHKWIVEKFHLSFVYAISYLILIFIGQKLMKHKAPLDVKWTLFCWNASLAFFSAFGTVRVVPEFIHALRHFGFRHSICSVCFFYASPVTGFWTYAFVMSKILELFDTVFLILRKKRIIFLHWFHHGSVLIFTWVALKELAGVGRWFMNMNFFIHTIMYTYYAITALKIRVPKILSISITVLQVIQMILGLLVSILSFKFWLKGEECDITAPAAITAIVLYGMYGLLFVNFFAKAYILPRFKSKKTN